MAAIFVAIDLAPEQNGAQGTDISRLEVRRRHTGPRLLAGRDSGCGKHAHHAERAQVSVLPGPGASEAPLHFRSWTPGNFPAAPSPQPCFFFLELI